MWFILCEKGGYHHRMSFKDIVAAFSELELLSCLSISYQKLLLYHTCCFAWWQAEMKGEEYFHWNIQGFCFLMENSCQNTIGICLLIYLVQTKLFPDLCLWVQILRCFCKDELNHRKRELFHCWLMWAYKIKRQGEWSYLSNIVQ